MIILWLKKEMLSKYQLIISDFYKIPIGNIKTPVSNFFDKEKYVLHYKNSQIYKRLGLKLKQIHRVLQFSQL